MSLHGKIKLNSTTLAEWVITRLSPTETADDTVCTYRCTYVRKGHPLAFLIEPLEFELQHRYGDGGAKLVSLMLARVAELEEETV